MHKQKLEVSLLESQQSNNKKQMILLIRNKFYGDWINFSPFCTKETNSFLLGKTPFQKGGKATLRELSPMKMYPLPLIPYAENNDHPLSAYKIIGYIQPVQV